MSLGQVVKQFIRDDSVDPNRAALFSSSITGPLLNWHCANIEYSSGTDIDTLSVRFWAADDVNAFEGDHCVLKQGYGHLAKEIANGLTIHLEKEVII